MKETRRLIEATCPDCRGPMSEVRLDELSPEYQCLVGHRYSARAFLTAHSDAQEKALWSAVVALEEAANLVRAVAGEFSPGVAERLEGQAKKKGHQALEVRKILEQLEPFAAD